MKSEVLVLELNTLFPGGGGGVIYYTVIYYVKSEVLDLESNLLFLGGGGGNLSLNQTYYFWGEGILLNTISHPKYVIWGIGGPYDDNSFDNSLCINKHFIIFFRICENVINTGASTGIGEQLAYQYARLSANVVITAGRAVMLKQVSIYMKLFLNLLN